MTYTPPPRQAQNRKPTAWNFKASAVQPDIVNLWYKLTVVIPFWDRTSAWHEETHWEFGTVTSDPIKTAGPWGAAIEFDETDDYIEWAGADAGASWRIALDEPFTIVAVVHTDDDLSGSNFEYFLSNGNFGAFGVMHVYFDEGTTPVEWNWVSENIGAIGSGTVIEEDTSYVLCVRRDRANEVSLWTNGVQGPNTGTIGDQLDAATNPMEVGRRGDGDTDRYFGGKIYAIYKWDRNLSDAEIRLLAADPFCVIRPNWDYLAGPKASLFATADGSNFQVVNEANNNSPLEPSVDDDPDVSPTDTDWINNEVEV